MQAIWMTDTHFDFIDATTKSALAGRLRGSTAQRLLLTGDIATGTDVTEWLMWLTEVFAGDIHFVLGNHDYYNSSLAIVDQQVGALNHPRLHWCDQSGVISLDESSALVGTGGWGDTGYGNFMETPIRLNDHRLIAELSNIPRPELMQRLQRRGQEYAAQLRTYLRTAVQQHSRVWVLTHVPPFEESCWYREHWGAWEWTADFGCKAVGDVLLELAEANPGCQFNVLCGHGHNPGFADMRSNLRVRTGSAEYRNPRIELTLDLRVDLRGDGIPSVIAAPQRRNGFIQK